MRRRRRKMTAVRSGIGRRRWWAHAHGSLQPAESENESRMADSDASRESERT
jgi:hypothetical protein